MILYGHRVFSEWESTSDFFAGDIVSFKYCTYRAIIDNKGIAPGTQSTTWEKILGPHPYIFLRDTATIEDLRNQVMSDDVYIKVYSFAALVNRNADDLFKEIVKTLQDSVKISFTSGDYGDLKYPAEFMISFNLNKLTAKQRQEIIYLIDKKYKYLGDVKKQLSLK